MSEEVNDFGVLLNGIAEEFDKACIDRHNMGAEQYGPLKFLGADTLQEAMHELVDLSNYARYTYTKLRLLQLQLAEFTESANEMSIGPKSFIKASPER